MNRLPRPSNPAQPPRVPPPLEIIHIDGNLAFVNKPPGISLLADRSGVPCLWDSLKSELGRPCLVHRLDKGTSGVLAVARNQATQSRLTRAFRDRSVRKIYLARVTGNLQVRGTGCIDLPLRPGRKSRYRVAGSRAGIVRSGDVWRHPGADGGHPSRTRFRVLRRDPHGTCLLLEPITGRTHQLRVHLSWIGHPVVGDNLYGNPAAPAQRAQRLMLHALRLRLPGYPAITAPVADFDIG